MSEEEEELNKNKKMGGKASTTLSLSHQKFTLLQFKIVVRVGATFSSPSTRIVWLKWAVEGSNTRRARRRQRTCGAKLHNSSVCVKDGPAFFGIAHYMTESRTKKWNPFGNAPTDVAEWVRRRERESEIRWKTVRQGKWRKEVCEQNITLTHARFLSYVVAAWFLFTERRL